MGHGCSPWAALALAGVLHGAPATAVTISYVEDLREIHAFSFDPGDPGDNADVTLHPSPAFSVFSTGLSFSQGEAWQVSSLGATGMFARGFIFGEPDVGSAGSGTSLFRIVFSVDEAAPWELSGVLEREEGRIGYNSAGARVVLSSGGVSLFSQSLPPIHAAAPDTGLRSAFPCSRPASSRRASTSS